MKNGRVDKGDCCGREEVGRRRRSEERNAEGQIKSEEGRRMKEGRRRNGKWEWGGEMDSRASA